MIDYFIKRKKLRYIKSFSRGYNHLEKTGELDLIVKLRNLLADKHVYKYQKNSHLSSYHYTCIHQFLVYRLINFNLNKELLNSLNKVDKKVCYPLPVEWRKILENNGFKALHWENRLIWFVFKLKWYSYGVFIGLKQLFNISKNNSRSSDSAYLFNLYESCFYDNRKYNERSDNIFSWLFKQKEFKSLRKIYHSNKENKNFELNDSVGYIENIIPSINNLGNFLFYFSWFVLKLITSLFDSKQSLILSELVISKAFEIAKDEQIYSLYLFHNSGHILRPLWTYEVEKRGSKIVFYFYSTNITSLKFKGKKYFQDNQWQVISWPIVWVWNKHQREFLLNYSSLKKYKIIIKGIIPFFGSSKKMKSIKNRESKKLLVFDVQPHLDHLQRSYASSTNYYTFLNSKLFFDDIEKIASKYNIKVFFKRKRKTTILHKKYLKFLDERSVVNDWIEIDPDFEISYICHHLKPDISISMPFTSTAIITNSANIPTIYYDPKGVLENNDFFNNGIVQLENLKQLEAWVKNYI